MRDQSWPWAAVGTVLTAPSGSFHMFYPHPLHFLNLLVPVINIFLPCFFSALFVREGLVVGGDGCPSQGKTSRNRAPQLEESLLSPTLKFFDALMLISPLVTIYCPPWLFTFFLFFGILLPFPGKLFGLARVRPIGETSRKRDHKQVLRKD